MRIIAILCAIVVALPASSFAQVPGTLISAEPVRETPPGMQAWRARYWTNSDQNRVIAVSAMIVAPREAIPSRPRPVIAWAHGTSGVAEKCALSTSPLFFAATPGLGDAVRRGYTVVAPDYPGLGSAGPHPYLVGVSTARSVLDAVRAARAIPGAASGTRFAVWGESQGGHAALWTGQVARDYAPELNLVGVAAAAPPTNLAANLNAGSDPSVRAFLTAFTAYSWSRHYGAPLATLGNRTTQGVITRLAQNNCITLGKKPKLGTVLGVMVLRRDLKNVDLGRIQPWAGIARRNSPAVRDYGVSFLIAQNPDDIIVAPAITRQFAKALCRNGARVRFLNIAGKGHETSALDSAGATLDWIDGRFSGAPVQNDCNSF